MNPDYEINKELGECYLFMGEYDRARGYYEKAAEAEKGCAEPYMGLAAVCLSEGDLAGAHALYAKADAVASSDKTLTGLAMVEVETGSHEEAFGHFIAALKHNPGNMIAINGLLQLSHFLGRLDALLPHLEAAVEADGADSDAVRYALAACHLKLGNQATAKEHLEALLGTNPSNSQAQELYAQLAA